MEYDYTKLKMRMIEKGYTQETLCEKIGMNQGVFSLRINNKRSFRQAEIEDICRCLGIKQKEIPIYFFAH